MKTFLKLMKAELIKTLGNYGPTLFLIGIFPAMALIFIGFWLAFVLLSADARQSMAETPLLWTDVVTSMWNIPNNLFGRAFLLAFVALQFGGEYQWNTWKNLVPHSGRVPLILAKFLVIGIIIVFTFVLTSVIAGVGM
ncbi:MAG: ABC transporter permease [Anaerolineae bacterium]|nr:ABC transporter permease [Anaerolineae bacterium]